MTKKKELTLKQKKFADFYIECGNATEAALKAGYSENSARFIAAENLAKPLIKEYIAQVMAIKDAERIANQDEILSFLTSVMRGEITEQVPLLNGDGYQKLEELDAAQMKDRIKCAELLGKRHAMWTDKQQLDGDLSVNIVIDYGDDEE